MRRMQGNRWQSLPLRGGLLLSVLFGGCHSMRSGNSDLLSKPLSALRSGSERSRFSGLPSERTMCVETARTVARNGHADEAILLFEKAERLSPSQPALDEDLAPLYAVQGKFDLAIERYRRLIEDRPEDPDLRNNLAWTLMEATRYDDALAEAYRGLRLMPDNQRLSSTIAVILYHRGDPAGALQQFREVLDESAAYHNMALLEFEAGNLEAARRHLAHATSLAEPSESTLALASAISAAGDVDQASLR